MKGSNPRVVALVEEYGAGAKDAEAVIRKLVRRVAAESGVHLGAPPFLPDRVAPHLRARLEPRLGLPVEAALQQIEGGFLVLFQRDLAPGRRNFALFHELVHIFFIEAAARRRSRLKKSHGTLPMRLYFEEERLCDFGAAEFLLPEDIFQRFAKGVQPSWSTVTELARLFGASIDATVLRLGTVLKDSWLVERWVMERERIARSTLFRSDDLARVDRRRQRRKEEVPPVIQMAARSGQLERGRELFFVAGGERVYEIEARRVLGGKGNGSATVIISVARMAQEEEGEIEKQTLLNLWENDRKQTGTF